MDDPIPRRLRRAIERHVADLLRDAKAPESVLDEARQDFVAHLEAEVRARLRSGSDEARALADACRRFGDRKRTHRALRDAASGGRGAERVLSRRAAGAPAGGSGAGDGGGGAAGSGRPSSRLADLPDDLRLACRLLVREPGFATAVVLTIALGVAATSTMFGIVDGTLLRPLPYPEPDRVVAVRPGWWFSKAMFRLLQEDATSFSAVAAYAPRTIRLADENGVRLVDGPRVTAGFFEVLGPSTVLGRTFTADEDMPDAAPVTVLTHGFWQRQFGGDPQIVGRSIDLEGVPHTVVGVLTAGYEVLQSDADLVVTNRWGRGERRFQSQEMTVIGRLAAGSNLEASDAEVRAIVAGWRERFGLSDGFGRDVAVTSLQTFLVGDLRPMLLLLFAAVGVVLLIVAANVASLWMARGLRQQREVSIRMALGARPGRIVRQVVTESTLLASLGGAGGLLGAVFSMRATLATLPPDTPRLGHVTLDSRVVAFAIAIALLTAWLVALVPALRLAATRLRQSLASGGRGATASHQRARRAIVAAEIGLAVALLAGAGLLIKSHWRLLRLDTGVRSKGLVVFRMAAGSGRLSSPAEGRAFHEAVRERLLAIPGVQAVTSITQAPFASPGGLVSCNATDGPPAPGEAGVTCHWRPVGEDYFAVAGTPLLEGRAFDDRDAATTEPVAILSVGAARRLFPGEHAIGRRVVTGFERAADEDSAGATVVGVVADVKFLCLAEDSPPVVYRPFEQVDAVWQAFGSAGGEREVLVRAESRLAGLADAVREAIRSVDRNALIAEYRTVEEAIAATIADRRAVLLLIVSFTLSAVLLAMLGVYGVTANAVRGRSRELSIRVALGASRRDVMADVMLGSLAVAAAGSLLGFGLALVVARSLRRFLYEVSGTDPWVLTSAIALAVATSLVASLLPARRAASADPLEALAAE